MKDSGYVWSGPSNPYKTYYVPEASVQLMSTQQYFREQNDCHATFTGEEMTIHMLHNEGVLKFPFHCTNNLPFMLLDKHQYLLPISSEDIHLLSSSGKILSSVTDQTNQNSTSSQKELLVWHWILAHANLPWIRSLFSEP